MQNSKQEAKYHDIKHLQADWRPVQGVPRLSPDDCWDRLQPPRDLTEGLSGDRKMDGWHLQATKPPKKHTKQQKVSKNKLNKMENVLK